MAPLAALTVAVACAVLLPRLLQHGMFLDGVTYAAIARNLAAGAGSFWAPHYTATIYPVFHEHPPLGLWLESLSFRVLGDHWWVERLHATVIFGLTALLIAVIWRRLGPGLTPQAPQQDTASPTVTESSAHAGGASTRGWGGIDSNHAWLPLLLWVAVPVVSWAVVGNMLEGPFTLFTTAALMCVVLGLATEAGNGALGAEELDPTPRGGAPRPVAVLWGAASGLCVAAAFLTKGPAGLFPLAAPVLLGWHRPRVAGRVLLAQWLTVAVVAAVLLAWPAAHDALSRYLDEQLVAALTGQREVARHRFGLVNNWLEGVALPLLVVGGVMVALARRWVAPLPADVRRATSWLLVGLSATVPLLLSPKQSGYYLVPSVPAFALACALLLRGTAARLAARLDTSAWRRVTLGASAIVVVMAVVAGLTTAGRDAARLADLDALASHLPVGQTIGICPETNADWNLHAWTQRRFRVSLDAREPYAHGWLLRSGQGTATCPLPRCTPATDASRALVLMRCEAGL